VALAVFGLALARPAVGLAKPFHCSAGDVQCLIDAINTANANGATNTIRLEAGTYTLTAVDNGITVVDGIRIDPNGLPVITSRLTIIGQGAERTIIERDAHAPVFRMLEIAMAASLRLDGLTVRGGSGSGLQAGGIDNHGTLTIFHSTIANNVGDVGGIDNHGTLTIIHSTIANNVGDFGGAIVNTGSVKLTHSSITDNDSGHLGGGLTTIGGTVLMASTTVTGNSTDGSGGLENRGGFVSITNSTFTENVGTVTGGILNGLAGTMFLTNSTLARNETLGFFGVGGGLENFGGTVLMQNPILALNTITFPPPAADESSDCAGVVTSLGHNLIGDPTSCTITLQPSDLTGDPGLGTFTDNGKPGNGHFPLLPTSQAIDAGNDAVCPRRDQLGQRRVDISKVGTSRCDIGAIESPDKDDRRHDDKDDPPDEDLAAVAQVSQR